MKKILFIALSLLALTSCSNSLNDSDQSESKKNTFYAMVTDSCYVIYLHGCTEAIFLNLNPTLEEMKKYNLSMETLEEIKNNKGMSRYVEGKRNNMFEIDRINLFLLSIWSFVLGIFSTNLVLKAKNKS